MLVERDHIGIFGKMNSGKSSMMNLLTQQQTSIVDPTPGTTADTKIALQEIHGMGPVKLFDTAGFDEAGDLGRKKRAKVLADLKECDLVLLVIDPDTRDFATESEILANARELDKQILVIYNLFSPSAEQRIPLVEQSMPLLKFHKKIRLAAVDASFRQPLLDFILANFVSKNAKMELLPFLERDEFYVLNIPMDAETPPGRYLRPQAMAEEYITRNWAYPGLLPDGPGQGPQRRRRRAAALGGVSGQLRPPAQGDHHRLPGDGPDAHLDAGRHDADDVLDHDDQLRQPGQARPVRRGHPGPEGPPGRRQDPDRRGLQPLADCRGHRDGPDPQLHRAALARRRHRAQLRPGVPGERSISQSLQAGRSTAAAA